MDFLGILLVFSVWYFRRHCVVELNYLFKQTNCALLNLSPPSVVAALLIYTPKQREHNPGAVPAVGNAKEEENAKMQQNRKEVKEYIDK